MASIAVLSASNGRIVLSPADIKSRLALLRTSGGFRIWPYGSFPAAIATMILPPKTLWPS
jgi:hypothetical protein